ncbi:hypothetical protein [Pseudobacteroides cellulosolvens]|uniref:Uncharacterized protein n=1 Tax=Pseudobacteroides cellulosolvens ATCC 35603 = DSM 2933 TaxID=398512 RepID=A0A0L6JPB7_9FIRM|nr:hypothetical protein [Pseudobacteroides cellulosolvens]KNY27555.1 hypothetical protein Bccel_2826 [Pseudobacteroides cellulosolvens ATCC 35603 = DSM 2933]
MKKVFYMKTRKPIPEDKKKVNIDKIGGLPTHKPLSFPKYPSGNEKGFIMQIYCDQEKFPDFIDNNILCWHIYANVNEHGDYEIVEVPVGAEINNNEGKEISRLEERIIYYEIGEEPDILNYDDEIDDYLTSRIGGSIPEDYIEYEKGFIGWIYESICDYELNIGGRTMTLMKNKSGNIEIDFE